MEEKYVLANIHSTVKYWTLTFSLLMLYIYGPTFGNAESRLFLFAAQCFITESMQKVISCGTIVCKHFASYQGYPNCRWDLIRYDKGSPRWCLHLIVVRRFVDTSDPENYTSGSVATSRASLAGQVKG
jgi:hypothetical protein